MVVPHRLRTALRRTHPWHGPERGLWRETTFAVIDVETTGLDLNRDEIVSVGVAIVEMGRISSRSFYEVARPSRPISESAMCVHSLTAEELTAAPPFAEVLPRLRAQVVGSAIVAHAAWVERAFLNRALQPLKERLPDRLVDTAAMARRLEIAQAGEREPSLEGLALQLRLPVHTPHHALGDAMTTAEVFIVLATRLERQLGALTVEELLGISG
ncbi:PolC-type DNA polymerase III [Kribbella sp. NPDC050124]|uniref:PolC-type DNA polymerase III n=1 Tax=Kribbella sp. NPDC050124 TaxID=3364114 RepID=UPI0037B9CAD3